MCIHTYCGLRAYAIGNSETGVETVDCRPVHVLRVFHVNKSRLVRACGTKAFHAANMIYHPSQNTVSNQSAVMQRNLLMTNTFGLCVCVRLTVGYHEHIYFLYKNHCVYLTP